MVPPPVGIWVAASPRHGPSPHTHQGRVGQSLSSGLAKSGLRGKAAQQWGGLSPHPGAANTEEHPSVLQWVPCRFYEKVQALHQDPKASVDNPLLAFSLIKRLHSDWPNIVYSDEATSNTQGTGKALGLGSPLSPGQGQEPVGRGWRGRRTDGGAGCGSPGKIAAKSDCTPYSSFPPCSTPCWPQGGGAGAAWS